MSNEEIKPSELIQRTDGYDYVWNGKCICGWYVNKKHHNYCPHCGAKLRWPDEQTKA